MTATIDRARRAARRRWIDHRTIWRWHFYAGVVLIPFMIVLAITGSIYLFKPQVEAAIDRPYDHLALKGPAAPLEAQVKAALAAEAGARLKAIELRADPTDAARIVVRDAEGEATRVYVRPDDLSILKVVREDDRFMQQVKTIHGELLMGDRGSVVVELAASWAILMVVSGLYLWWPRGRAGLAGTLVPRLGRGGRLMWRDLHAVTGFWISGLALFLLVTGLPWTNVWGAAFKEARKLTGTAAVHQDWTISRKEEHAEHRAEAMAEDHMAMGRMDHAGMDHAAMTGPTLGYDRIAGIVRAMDLPPPVMVRPPSGGSPMWRVSSETQDRPLRVSLELDPATGAVARRETFAAKHPIDKVVGVAIAAHEGQLFGPLNQALGVIAAAGLVTLSAAGAMAWWRRRPEGVLGAPERLGEGQVARGWIALVVALGLFLPTLGVSLIAIGLVETLVLRRLPGVRVWLGLAPA
ncbi:PepSY-associated TM helix domain-containing protein [Phenylobacterium sp.]|uniref:PepSY-associated TM helix domain-containing protein n=1 Tax=Phenylobacterium sp. TaxID=1871053 RepID=UPI0035AE666D